MTLLSRKGLEEMSAHVKAWGMAADVCLLEQTACTPEQGANRASTDIHGMSETSSFHVRQSQSSLQAWDMAAEMCLLQLPALLSGEPDAQFLPSPFFAEQLTAFELWLAHGSSLKQPPEQLPIVLQVRQPVHSILLKLEHLRSELCESSMMNIRSN